MRTPSAAEFLSVWEHGLESRPYERALALLAAACPENSPEELASLTIGQRDALLLSLRESAFGRRFVALASCPDCAQTLELELDAAELHLRCGTEAMPAPRVSTIQVGSCKCQLRAPTSADLMAAAGLDYQEASQHILARCLDVNESDRDDLLPKLSGGEFMKAAVEAIATLDPFADIQLDVQCASCSRSWVEQFDIVSLLWDEIDAWARRMLREIHCLAAAYGWRESEILALTPLRRHFYLEMACA